jgi:hypothetical protein
MDERDQERQLIDAETEGTGRLRNGVERVRKGIDRVRAAVGRKRPGGGRVRGAAEDGAWFLRERIAWPAEDRLERLGSRGAIGVFGGGGIALAGVVAALLIAGSGGSGSATGTTEAFVTPQHSPAPAAVAPAPKPKKQASKPTGPTLHGAPPSFSPAQKVKAGVGDGRAVSQKQPTVDSGEAPTPRGAAANDTPASTAKIGTTPKASASAQTQADSLAKASSADVAETEVEGSAGEDNELTGPPAPRAAKRVARRFAEAFVVYEVGGIDGKVRQAFNQTSTKQLSRSLLHRPPRQPASVKVPQAKVVNVVAGPSKGSVYTVSVSLLRVGVTSELRLEMEQGVGKKWQVTNVLG